MDIGNQKVCPIYIFSGLTGYQYQTQGKEIKMRVVATIDSKDVLCGYCQNNFADCPKANHIKFGNGIGNDNVIECSEFITKSWGNMSKFPIIGKPELGVIQNCRLTCSIG